MGVDGESFGFFREFPAQPIYAADHDAHLDKDALAAPPRAAARSSPA